MNSKIFVSYDQFDAMAVAVTNDSFIQPNSRGVRRMVRFLSYIDRTTLTSVLTSLSYTTSSWITSPPP